MVNWQNVELEWDDWNVNHLLKHNVRSYEIEELLNGRIDKWKEKDVYCVIGECHGRILFVVLAPRGGNVLYPISARDADDKMKKRYRRRK